MAMKIYCFGNPDIAGDSIALEIADKLNERFPQIEFVKCTSPDFLLALDEKEVVVLDAVKGIDKVMIIDDINKICYTKTTTMHDFDLGTVLKLMMETGRIEKVGVIGVPINQDKTKTINQIKEYLMKL